jgi:hypothetical protein
MSAESCYFWDGTRCHYEMLVIGVGGPCADCPDEDDAVASLDRGMCGQPDACLNGPRPHLVSVTCQLDRDDPRYPF